MRPVFHAGHLPAFAMLNTGLRRVLMSTYARVHRFANKNGATTLSNDRVAAEFHCSRRTIARHVQSLRREGLVFAVFGNDLNAPSGLKGYRRWMLTHGPKFADALKQAVAATGGFASLYAASETDTIAPESLWRFLAVQAHLFPGSANAACHMLLAEGVQLPEGIVFTGACDREFFVALLRETCPWEDVRNGTYNSLSNDRESPKPPKESADSSGGLLPILSSAGAEAVEPQAANRLAASAEASENQVPVSERDSSELPGNPNEVGSEVKHILSVPLADLPRAGGLFQLRRAYEKRELVGHIIEHALGRDKVAATAAKDIRMLRKTADCFSDAQLEFCISYLPYAKFRNRSAEWLADHGNFDRMHRDAAKAFFSTDWDPIGNWQWGAAQDDVGIRQDFICSSSLYGCFGWDCALDRGRRVEGLSDAQFWNLQAAQYVYQTWKLAQAGDVSAQEEHAKYDRSPLVALTVLQHAVRHPHVWRAMFMVAELHGAAKFTEIFGFCVRALQEAVCDHYNYLVGQADSFYDLYGPIAERAINLPDEDGGFCGSGIGMDHVRVCRGSELMKPDFVEDGKIIQNCTINPFTNPFAGLSCA